MEAILLNHIPAWRSEFFFIQGHAESGASLSYRTFFSLINQPNIFFSSNSYEVFYLDKKSDNTNLIIIKILKATLSTNSKVLLNLLGRIILLWRK